MEEFKKLYKTHLYEIIEVAKASYERRFFEDYVIKDIIAAFDDNQRYKIELYGFFRHGKLVHFAGFAESLSVGNAYEMRLSTTLPEFRNMGYAMRGLEKRLAILTERHRNEKIMIQLSTRHPHRYKQFGFKSTGYKTIQSFEYMYKLT
jgi:hypothetical protein